MTEEKEKIYVEISEGIKIELNLPRRVIEEYGGVENIQEHTRAAALDLYGDLLTPSLKYEIGRMKLDFSLKKLKLMSETKDISAFLN